MSSMKKTKEGINLKKLLRLKNTGSIFVIAGLLMIFVIALYTFILQRFIGRQRCCYCKKWYR